MKTKILVVDDEASIVQVLLDLLTDEGYETQSASSGEEALRMISSFQPDIILLDIWMPGSLDGLDVLKEIKSKLNLSEVIMMSGHGTIETAVQATKVGAWGFLEKPLVFDKLHILIKQILIIQKERKEKNFLLSRLREDISLIGSSDFIKNCKKNILNWSKASAPVLICGEASVGKKILAKNIHYMGERSPYDFVSYFCANSAQSLQIEELFGRQKSFRFPQEPAKRSQLSYTHKGSLFLRNIEFLNLDAQKLLCSFIKSSEYQSVGSDKKYNSDVHIIASTSADLKKMADNGTFLKDLYSQFAEVINVPSLSSRKQDLQDLILYFLSYFSKKESCELKSLDKDAMDFLLSEKWQFHAKELKNFIEKIYIFYKKQNLNIADIKKIL
ncbi:MAG: sigma-54-dependent Fis family transcriptional regulator [Bdellovibrionales bacterium]|nr:sigma-54-dependent Fis family transcriptional regulator [Bdellovibrionales bacterium]